jgi:hypothetical protein
MIFVKQNPQKTVVKIYKRRKTEDGRRKSEDGRGEWAKWRKGD